MSGIDIRVPYSLEGLDYKYENKQVNGKRGQGSFAVLIRLITMPILRYLK